MPQRPLSNSEKYVSSQTMAVARINLKNIDYFKFKKLVIDGNRDDYGSCSKEVQALCDCVQTLKFRDEEFDDESDRMRFAEICIYYKQILNSKRIESLDMRIKSGWWGDHKNAYSAGKIKPAALKELLISKAQAWTSRHPPSQLTIATIPEKIDGPGLYVFKHKEHQCFQFVGRADRIFSRVGEKLKASFEGGLTEPLAALLVISMATDWDFYFMPVSRDDDERVLRVMENDLILKHDCIWPHGLNFRLHIDSLLEVSEFRKSCLRHSWPPEAEVGDNEINLSKLRRQIEMQEEGINPEIPPEIVETPKKMKRRSKEERPPWEGIIDEPPSPAANGKREHKGEAFVIPAFDPEPFERPDSPKSDISSSTFVVAPQRAAPPSEITTSPIVTPTHTPTPGQRSPTKAVSRPTSRPTTPAKKAPRSAGIKSLQGQIPKKKQVSS